MNEMSTFQHVESHISIQKYPGTNAVSLYFTTDVFRMYLYVSVPAMYVQVHVLVQMAFRQPYMTYVYLAVDTNVLCVRACMCVVW